MSNVKTVILIIQLILMGLVFYIIYNNSKTVVPNSEYQSLIERIDSLNAELDILKLQKDSLLNVIDTSKVKIKVIEHWYERELTDITNQSIADDVVFFTEYLSEVNK